MHNILCHNCPHPVSAAAAWWAQQHHSHNQFQKDHGTAIHHLENPHQNGIHDRHQLIAGGAQPSTPRTPTTSPDHSHGNNTPNPPTSGNTSANSMMSSSPQYVSVTVDRDTTTTGAEGQGVNNNSSYGTYVEGSRDHSSVYAANGPASFPGYSVGESAGIYNTNAASTQYYSASSTEVLTPYTQESGGGMYLIPSTGTNNNYIAGDGAPNTITPATQVSPATVQWLLENYETAEGVSLPRYTMYYHYLRHCADHKLDPVNAASFGKLIRSVFLGLRTRRLGTRGNSKYHYYGIRLKPNSTLNQLYDDGAAINGPNGYYTVNGRGTGVMTSSIPGTGNVENHRQLPATHNNNNHTGKRMKLSKSEGYDGSLLNGLQVNDPNASQFLGDHTRVLHNFPELEESMELPEGVLPSDIIIFKSLYKEHCESLLDALVHFQMANVESYWRTFWRAGGCESNLPGVSMEPQNYENLLPKQKLILLCTIKKVQDFIRSADFHFYQNIVGFLLPDILQPIPSSMTQAIRSFAKALEGWLTSAMSGFPQEIVSIKVTAVSSLAQMLRRYTSLNHLAQAARAVLQNQNQISQMLTDLNRVDFSNIEEQASWVCGCGNNIFPSLEQDFKGTLTQQQTLEQWAAWLEGVVDRILRPHMPSPNFVHLSRQFLLKWSYCSSLIIRDLTLRSAASFGSFHLLRLLYDEYIFYLVEHMVARVTGVVPIAVIGRSDMSTITQPIIIKTEGGLLSDPSSADIMEVFAHTTNTNIGSVNTRENSMSITQNTNRNCENGTSVLGNMDSVNNSSLDGSSSLNQASTTVISSHHHHHSDQDTSNVLSSIKLSPK